MIHFKTRAAWLLAAAATGASAIGGYQVLKPKAAAPAAAMPITQAAEQPPATAAKSGALAFINSALRREIEALKPTETVGVFVHFTPSALAARLDTLKQFGLQAGTDFHPWADSVFATGTAAQLLAIAADPGVYYLEHNEKLRYSNHTANWALRTRVTQERVGLGPYYDASGKILDGAGVGVAVIDSGLDGTHGDFTAALAGGRNYKISCGNNVTPEAACGDALFVDVGTTGTSDTTSGHGHHVAGTVLGNGTRSLVNYPDAAGTPYIKGSFAGVAPGAKLYAYGTGEAIAVLTATQAYRHILRNYDNRTVFPTPVRVTNNSYGSTGGTAYDAAATASQLIKRMVTEKNIIMVFAAGNDGDGTTVDKTSPACKDPTPGVICVASYDDLGTGSRKGIFSDFTSQGAIGTPANYPDVAAPGSNITSTCTAALPICKDTGGGDTAFLPFYGTISGTSMATPHVVGSIALLLQAKPGLTAAEVEDLLQDNAIKVADNTYGATQAAYISDPQNTGGTTNYRAGAGLVDLPRVLDALNVAKFGTLPADVETTVISGDANNATGADNRSQTAVGANDFVKLTVQHESLNGVAGLRWRLTVADAANFAGASFVTYQIISNIDGKQFTTGGTLKATGFTADGIGASTSAAATNASKVGNVLSLFVPLASLGTPPIGAPAHNVRVVVTSDASGNDGEVDYAPSADPVTGTSTTAPGWGKPFTILTVSSPLVENRCTVPGLTLLNDAGGDATTSSDQDMLSVNVAQPFASSGMPNLTFTIKVASLSTLNPGSGYFVSFKNPAGTVVGVRMDVLDPSAPTFSTYAAAPSGGTAPQTDGRFVDTQAAAEAGSKYEAATGTITIIAKPSALGLTKATDLLTGFNGGVTQSSDPGVGVGGFTLVTDEMPDGLGRVGAFEFKSNAFCTPNTLPVAVLKANKTTGSKPLTVDFDGKSSSDVDAGDAVTGYVFRFGDDGSSTSSSTGLVSHTYTRSGSFQATLKVADTRGGESSTLSMQTITVINDPPTAMLKADKTSGTAPLSVAFDATGGTDPNGDTITLYSFDLDGNGSFEIVDSDSAKPSFTYNTAGSYTAKVKAKDSEGLESAVVTQVITVTAAGTANTAPMAQLNADKTSGEAPLTVTFDASGSSDADSGDAVVSYSFDLDGNGSYEIVDSSNAMPKLSYAAAGSYVAKVMVKDKAGAVSAAATRTITVTGAPTGSNRPPVAVLRTPQGSVAAQTLASFDGVPSHDPDGNDGIAALRFDFGDGTAPVTVAAGSVDHRYAKAGTYTVSLTVTDTRGATSAVVTQKMVVGPAATPATFSAADASSGVIGDATPTSGGAASPALLAVLGLLALQRRRRLR